MSIFQKITNLLFEENDVDVIAEDELEDISLQEEEKQKEKRLAKAAAAEKEAKQTVANQQPQPKKQEAKLEDSSELKKAVRIDLKEEKDSKKATASKRSYSSVSHRSTVLEEQKEFEFTPVISPIFGASDVETDKAKKKTSVLLPKSKKQNPLGTVISPYYGLGELEEMEEQAKEDILRKAEEIESEEDFVAFEESEKIELDETDLDSIPLDDLIVDNDTEEDEEDMMQISLFGDSTPIKESDNENKKV